MKAYTEHIHDYESLLGGQHRTMATRPEMSEPVWSDVEHIGVVASYGSVSLHVETKEAHERAAIAIHGVVALVQLRNVINRAIQLQRQHDRREQVKESNA